jgi:G:T/U-mismatch repair DNA glycosylase
MDFFYPNYINDMWRIFGLCLYGDKNHFVDEEHRTCRREAIVEMLHEQGIALYDTAAAVRRLKNTASDKDLEVVEPTDLSALVRQLPLLQNIVTTGEKATGLLAAHFCIQAPRVGAYTDFTFEGRPLRFYRMPSSSRAYPLRLEKKAEYYHHIIHN